jgi:hypothetical protein
VPYGSFHAIFTYVYMGASGDKYVYIGMKKGICLHIENNVVL